MIILWLGYWRGMRRLSWNSRGQNRDGDGDEEVEVEKPVAIPSLGATHCKFYRYRGIPAYVFLGFAGGHGGEG